jgi:hypothetical protein
MSRKRMFDECTLWSCHNPHYALGYCLRHYRNAQRYGDPYIRADDFIAINEKFEEARDLLHELSADGFTKVVYKNGDPDHKAEIMCRHCGAWAYAKDDLIHEEDCPVIKAQALLVETDYYDD